MTDSVIKAQLEDYPALACLVARKAQLAQEAAELLAALAEAKAQIHLLVK
jgi:hypothetical protein